MALLLGGRRNARCRRRRSDGRSEHEAVKTVEIDWMEKTSAMPRRLDGPLVSAGL